LSDERHGDFSLPRDEPFSHVSRPPDSNSRREFFRALLVAFAALFVVGLTWLLSREAPSSERDPEFTPPALAPRRADPDA
jgi:hypothetical protein